MPTTGARHRGSAPRRNWLGLVAPFRGIIHMYFFLRGENSQAANFVGFRFCTVRCNAASGLSGQWGDEGPARALAQWPGGPQRDPHHRAPAPSIVRALHPSSEFCPLLGQNRARQWLRGGSEAQILLSGAHWRCGPTTRAWASAGQFFALREELALRSGRGLSLDCCTMPARAAHPGPLQVEECAGQPGPLRHADADRPGCPDRAPREVRGSSLFVEFGPFWGQTRAREARLAPDCDGCRLGGASMRSDAVRAGRPSAVRGERAMPSSDDEWLRAAESAATVAALEVELDDERERHLEGDAADSEHERDAHDARLSELHRAACLRRTSGSAFKHQVGPGNAATTGCAMQLLHFIDANGPAAWHWWMRAGRAPQPADGRIGSSASATGALGRGALRAGGRTDSCRSSAIWHAACTKGAGGWPTGRSRRTRTCSR